MAVWLATEGRTQAWLGDRLGIAQSTVSAWLAGTTRPEAHVRKAIDRVTGAFVREDAWMTEDEHALILRSSRREKGEVRR